MEPDERRRAPRTGSEPELLSAFLDFQRDTLLWKVSGLNEGQLRQPLTPSGVSLLGLVKHLAYVERNWFKIRFGNEPLTVPWRDGDPGGDFRIDPGDTSASVIAFYEQEVADARRIVAEADSLDVIAQHPDRPVSLRWILIHMIEETARHVGHADILREQTDGQTGE